MKTACDTEIRFRVGDFVEITDRSKHETRTHRCAISSVEQRDGFCYVTWTQQGLTTYDPTAGSFGTFRWYAGAPRPFGVQSVKVLGRATFARRMDCGFMVRNPGYDLIH